MWPPRLRRQAATRTLKLSPTFLQVARGTCCTYSVTCLFKASSVLGLALYTSSFAAPHSQKSRGFRSGLWGAHSTSLFSAINLPSEGHFQRWRRRRRSLSCLSVASLQFLQVERSPKNVIVIVYSAVEVKMRLIREPYEAHQVGMGL